MDGTDDTRRYDGVDGPARYEDLEDPLRYNGFPCDLPDGPGRTRPGRGDRRHIAWFLLAIGLGGFAVGIAIGHGLLIAAGLVLAGLGGHLFEHKPDRNHAHQHRRPPL